MNTMKSFYVSLSAGSKLRDPYMEALSQITKIHHRQAMDLASDLGWQQWGAQTQETAAA